MTSIIEELRYCFNDDSFNHLLLLLEEVLEEEGDIEIHRDGFHVSLSITAITSLREYRTIIIHHKDKKIKLVFESGVIRGTVLLFYQIT